MDIEEIERDFIKYIEEHKGIQSTFGTLEFNKSNRIGQGGNGLVYLAR